MPNGINPEIPDFEFSDPEKAAGAKAAAEKAAFYEEASRLTAGKTEPAIAWRMLQNANMLRPEDVLKLLKNCWSYFYPTVDVDAFYPNVEQTLNRIWEKLVIEGAESYVDEAGRIDVIAIRNLFEAIPARNISEINPSTKKEGVNLRVIIYRLVNTEMQVRYDYDLSQVLSEEQVSAMPFTF